MKKKTKKEILRLNFCKLERALFLITPKTKKGRMKVNEMYGLLEGLEKAENMHWEDYHRAVHEQDKERFNDDDLQSRSIRRI